MSSNKAIRTTIDVEVRYAETDQMGVVHHSVYLVWFELARTALCRQSGFPYHEIEATGYWLMVTGANLEYRAGARYGETVQVTTWVESLKSRTLTFGYEVKLDDQLLVSGTTEHVWVHAATRRPRRIPDELRTPFEHLAGVELPTLSFRPPDADGL